MGRIEQVTHTNAAHAQETAAAAVSVNEQVRATQDQIDWLEVVVGH
jgi:methyl-accepting chemotaxis protein